MGRWFKRGNIFLLRLGSFWWAYRTFLISRNACHGISSRELHRCVRIEKPSNLGFCFAQFGVRKPLKSQSNRSPRICPNLTPGWILLQFLGPFSGTNRSDGRGIPPERIFLTCYVLTAVLISALDPFLLLLIRDYTVWPQTRFLSFSLYFSSSSPPSMIKT